MVADVNSTTPRCVFKIGELTRLIASHLVLISPKSAVRLARSSRYLEEPVLSTLWETQPLLCTLLRVLPKKTWHIKHKPRSWVNTVRALNLQLEKSNTGTQGCFSSRSWGIHHHGTGTEYNATHLGCARPAWTNGWSSGKAPSLNYASIHRPVDGSQRWKIYLGASRNPISLTSTYSPRHI